MRRWWRWRWLRSHVWALSSPASEDKRAAHAVEEEPLAMTTGGRRRYECCYWLLSAVGDAYAQSSLPGEVVSNDAVGNEVDNDQCQAVVRLGQVQSAVYEDGQMIRVIVGNRLAPYSECCPVSNRPCTILVVAVGCGPRQSSSSWWWWW
jgi:hypothetical protein